MCRFMNTVKLVKMVKGDIVNLQDIYSSFNHDKTTIESNIATLKTPEDLTTCRLRIQELNNSFSNNDANFLQTIPAYDLKYYSESIDKLIESVELRKREMASLSGVKKFTFKNRTLKSNTAAITQRATEHIDEGEVRPQIENIINETYTIPESAPKSLFIKTIVNSTIFTPESVIPYSIHLSNLKDSKIVVSSKSSIFIESLDNCQIITKSLQLRLHEITNSIIVPQILNDANRIVIEGCKGLRVGRLPGEKFVEVDDFKIPNKLKNPNYDFLNDDDEVYKDIKVLVCH